MTDLQDLRLVATLNTSCERDLNSELRLSEKFRNPCVTAINLAKLKQKSDKGDAPLFPFIRYWWKDLVGRLQVMRRIAPAKLKEVRQPLKDWTSKSRHKRLYQIAKQLRVKVLGHNPYFALKVNGQCLWHYYSMALLFKWFNRRSQWRRYNWAVYKQLLDVMGLPKLELMDDRRFGITCLFNKGTALHGSIVITEEPVAVVPHAGIYVAASG